MLTTTAFDAVNAFDALITALSGEDAFVAATKEDGDGVLEKAALSAEKAMDVSSTRLTSMSGGGPGDDREHALRCLLAAGAPTLRATISSMSTRTKTQIGGADPSTDDDETAMDLGKVGVFAYSVIDDVTKTIDLPTTGNLHYMRARPWR